MVTQSFVNHTEDKARVYSALTEVFDVEKKTGNHISSTLRDFAEMVCHILEVFVARFSLLHCSQ